MRWVSVTASIVIFLCLPLGIEAADRFTGNWNMTAVSLDVTIDSWGQNCGTRPKSYNSQDIRHVLVTETGGHLIIQKGQVRTDRCGSPNPKIQTVLSRRTESRWKRECQTPKDDPKFETGVYTLKAINDNRLEYTAESRFSWNLKGDRCVVRALERRVFIRADSPTPIPDTPPKKAIEPATPADAQTPPTPSAPPQDLSKCVKVGPADTVEIEPKSATLGPGDKVCFAVKAVDTQGCPIKKIKDVSWTVTQDGIPINGLLSKTGCFIAGETAAETEGLYTVSVRAGGKVAAAEISVVFAELGDLFAARLKPLENARNPEQSARKPTAVNDKKGKSGIPDITDIKKRKNFSKDDIVSTPTLTAPEAPDSDNMVGVMIPAVIVVLGLLGLGIAGGVFVRRAAKRGDDPDNDDDDDWPETTPFRSSVPVPGGKHQGDTDPPDSARVCPSCGRSFDANTKLCPYDRIMLIPTDEKTEDNADNVAQGMICPKCHRGYESDARFCPHDSERLVPYATWRISKKPPSPANEK